MTNSYDGGKGSILGAVKLIFVLKFDNSANNDPMLFKIQQKVNDAYRTVS